jgi:hypothetical protein
MRRATTTTATAALLAVALTACAGGGPDVESDPEAALREAIAALGDYDGIELIASIDADEDALVAAAEGDLDGDDVRLLLDSEVVLRGVAADDDDEGQGQAEVVVALGGETVAELRAVDDQAVYVRLDPDAAAEALDDPDLRADLEDAISTLDDVGLGDVATTVRDGEWIRLTGLQQLADATGAEEPSEEEAADLRARLVGSLQRFLDEDVEVTYVGEEDPGERVTATTTASALAELLEEVTTAAGDLGGLAGDDLGFDPDEVGDDPVTVDVWLDRGRLSQVGVDLANLAEDGDGAPEGTFLLVRVEEFGGSVDAPSEATEVDLLQVFGQLLGGGFGGAPGGDGADGAAPDLDAEAPEADATDGDPLGGGCIPQEEIDAVTGGDPAAEAEVDAAVDAGLLEIC